MYSEITLEECHDLLQVNDRLRGTKRNVLKQTMKVVMLRSRIHRKAKKLPDELLPYERLIDEAIGHEMVLEQNRDNVLESMLRETSNSS